MAGWTDVQLADFFGINECTLRRWRDRYPEFAEKMANWKETADAKVERSCYESAIGYSCPEEKIFFHEGKVIRVQTTKHYAPNPIMNAFWLTNRKFGDWKRTRQETGSDPLSVKVLTMVNANDKKITNKRQGKNAQPEVQSTVMIERGGMQIVE